MADQDTTHNPNAGEYYDKRGKTTPASSHVGNYDSSGLIQDWFDTHPKSEAEIEKPAVVITWDGNLNRGQRPKAGL